ncbi:uncharacterized protein B0I36DRAFT_359966 [Microdochium trichocladiopsis]|uniref:FAD-binding PCMH-type domain-containing protein n=1 Tax=Microdochium trichocladiopsis TaxID=1682393 RepID=A0A9P8YFB1_9PEZI|nr:uncharacterized protein B0I36DRAFT_359966 [Microdochium trichocladiopsis]KAH7038390.1 hypothetical protein B0I36DRAFT_359966 [Microdochium trichocladiopsis]
MKLAVTVVAAAAVVSARCPPRPPVDVNVKCCADLAADASLKGKVYLPGTSAYTTRLGEYYSANAALAPSCMVLPTTTEEVSTIAALIHKSKCQFGMRAGGHSAFAGSNSVAAGVTVDFGYMNTTTYTAGDRTAAVQAGSTWGKAYETLDPFGVTVAGGRASVVGVGGFITGGGYSFHSNRAGFGCDTVRNFEIVLANGTVVNANAEENADLWRAQKGGSGNFGFITRVDMDVQPTNKLWAGFVGFQPEQVEEYYEAYIDFVDNMASDLASQTLLGVIANEGTTVTRNAIVSNSLGIVRPPAFDRTLSVPNVTETLFTDSINIIVPVFTGPTPLGLFSNWMVEMYASDIRILTFIDAALLRATAKMRAAAPDSVFQVLLELQPVTQSMVQHSTANGGNVLGLEAVVADGPAVMFLIALTVDTAANQDIILPLTIEFREEVNAYANSLGLNKNWKYAPYALGDQDPLSHYGEENLALIRSVSKKFDPTGDFQTLRRSGFKIPV